MREKIILVLGTICAVILSLDLYKILLVLPNEKDQGAIYRIIYFHVPSIITGFTGFFVALVASGMYLATRNLKYDAFAAAVTEVSLAFATVVLATGSIWGRIIWGIWWTWDARLTSALVCWLLYAGYLMLRRAIDEPTQRATFAAVFSIFAFIDVPIVIFSIKWWRTQHPAPVFWGGGSIPADWVRLAGWNWLAMILLGIVLTAIRLRQEESQREIDSLRRMAHAM